MSRGPLFDEQYKPVFSGHETFPLRHGWLKKAYDAVASQAEANPFLDPAAIARFGVGKNMVGSIRHWALFCGIVEETESGKLVPTVIGKLLCGRGGVDPYLEHKSTLWLLHWLLCSGSLARPFKTTWYWVFSFCPFSQFRRDEIVEALLRLAAQRGWQRVSQTTVQRDVECFVRTYEAKGSQLHGTSEDVLESPLSELSLLRGIKGQFSLNRGPKATLSDAVIAYALHDFWNQLGAPKTLSFEAVAHAPGSPGRVFLLEEGELVGRLSNLEQLTEGTIRWSETAGLRQVIFGRHFTETELVKLLRSDYATGVTSGVLSLCS